MSLTTSSALSSYSSTATSTSSSSTSSSSSLNFDDFLELMVTQLQNQNPLDPTDTDSYVQQLVSYSTLNQLTSMSDQLSSLSSSINSLVAGSAIGYVGHTVEAYGDTTTLSDGKAAWGYSLDSAAETVTIKVKDADGNTVYTTSGETSAGAHGFTWDGTSSSGQTLADGQYTIEVSATDASGNAVGGTTTISGTVTGVDSSSGTMLLKIGETSVPFANVYAIVD